MLYLRNFQIWSTAPPQAAVVEQLGMEGSNGRRQHHTAAECITPQGEHLQCFGLSGERLGLPITSSIPPAYQNHIHCGFRSCPSTQLHPFSLAQAGEGWLYTGCIPMPRTVNRQPGLTLARQLCHAGADCGDRAPLLATQKGIKTIVPPHIHNRMKT